MTREEAAKILYQEKSNAGWMRWVGFPVDIKKEQDYKRFILAVDVALDALRGPEPDPITGLAPCGCGGKAETHELYGDFSGTYMTDCKKCATGTTQYNTKKESQDAWNTAMGWKGGAE